MPADPSIYNQPNGFAVGLQQGATLGEMYRKGAQERKLLEENEAVKEAYRQGVTQNPDGTVTIDKAKTLSGLFKSAPQKALEQQDQWRQQDQTAAKANMEKQLQQLDLTSRLLGSVKDQPTYDAARAEASKYGLDVSKLPTTYDPNHISFLTNASLTAKDRMEQAFRKMQFESDTAFKRSAQALDREKFNLEKTKVAQERSSGEKMPIDQKKLVETLAVKNANKTAIKNQIESVMANWDSLPEDQKVAQGGQLLKTLNSAEGADAIGVEEAKRLGAKLEFAFGNVGNSNPTQFGRDLEGFKKQALDTAANMGNAVKANQAQIDQAMGRAPREQAAKVPAAVHSEAVMWAHNNPKDPRAAEILRRNGVSPKTAQGGL